MGLNNQEKKFLRIIKENKYLLPFENFVAKSDIEEKLSLVKNRSYIINYIIERLKFDNQWKIIPITGDTGQGKTFVCWKIKQHIEIRSIIIFLEIPVNRKLFYYDLYTKIIENAGSRKIRDITNILVNKWGASEKKFGLFQTSNTEKILKSVKKTIRYRWSKNKDKLEECIKVIIAHALEPEKSQLAERWLLGEIMDMEELFYLGVENSLNSKSIAKELFNLFINYFQDGIIVIFDDLDKKWEKFGKNDYFEDEWSGPFIDYSLEKMSQTDEKFKNSIFYEIADLIRENNNLKVIFTFDSCNIKEVLSKFPYQTKKYISEIVPINNFSTKDVKDFYFESLSRYLSAHSFKEFENNRYFPLSEKFILRIFEKTNGNPRKLIRMLQDIFDKIIYENKTIEDFEY